MNTEQAKKLSEDALTRLMEALDRGESDTLKTYLKSMARFHRYSAMNCLLILSQCPAASHVAGYQAWRKLGRQVVKGAKGIVILAPMVGRKKSDDELTEDEQTRIFGFRAAHVFDIAATTGATLPEFATVHGDPREYMDRLKAFVAGKGIALEYSDAIAPAKGLCAGKVITLLPGLEAGEAFAVLVHETAHAALHFGDRRNGTTKTIRETEAEAVAYVVSEAIGLDTTTSASDYILTHGGDPATLADSLAFIQRTAAEILDAIMPDVPVLP
jgi:antirestriction protein ArdC